MHIRLDNLAGPEIHGLLDNYLGSMARLSPPSSIHTLDIDALRKPDVTFWTAWSRHDLLGA